MADLAPIWAFLDENFILNSGMISNDTRSFYGHGRSFPLFLRSSVTFQGHTSRKIDDFLDLDPIWARLLGRWQLSYLSDLHCLLLMIQYTFFLRPCRSLNQYIVWQDLGKHRDTTNIDNVHICLTHIIATHRSDWAAVWGVHLMNFLCCLFALLPFDHINLH